MNGNHPIASSVLAAETGETIDPEQWVDAFGDVLFAYAMQRVRNRHTAEELVQETLLIALDRLDSFEGRSSFQTWLVGILRNKIIQRFQEQVKSGPSIESDLEPHIVESQFTKSGKWKQEPGHWGHEPGLAEQEDFRRVLDACMEKLPARTAQAFVLAEQYQMATDALCRILRTTPANVYVLLYRARTALRRCLETNWFTGRAGKER